MIQEAEDLGLLVKYHAELCDRSKPLPPSFEVWKKQQVITNPQTFADLEKPILGE